MKKTDLERLTELAQACVARTPVIVLGVRLASRAVAWRSCDIERWSEARPLASRQLSSPRRVKGGRDPAPANP